MKVEPGKTYNVYVSENIHNFALVIEVVESMAGGFRGIVHTNRETNTKPGYTPTRYGKLEDGIKYFFGSLHDISPNNSSIWVEVPSDYNKALIDLALIFNDKEWFMELTSRFTKCKQYDNISK